MTRRQLVEAWTGALIPLLVGKSSGSESNSNRIFVLRNNDLGDVLAVTPMFEAIKKLRPSAQLAVGVGRWSVPLLRHNPWVDEVFEINAPWHNQVTGTGSNSIPGLLRSLRYIFLNQEMQALKRWRPGIGIDVLGSPEGALLLASAGITQRIGMRGYASDGRPFQDGVDFDPTLHVGEGAVRLAGCLGGEIDVEIRPQVYLSESEKQFGENWWKAREGLRIVLAPGGGYETKRWPLNRFVELAQRLSPDWNLAVLGSARERGLGEMVTSVRPQTRNVCGDLQLRESLAVVASADAVVCNSSMLMHAAAAFRKPCVTLLGPIYTDAEQHQTQWGYPEPSVVLGRQSADDPLPEVDQVLSALIERVRT